MQAPVAAVKNWQLAQVLPGLNEACFVVEGSADITERDTGAVHHIGPGSVYSPEHDRHTIRVHEPLRLVCVFNPALTGQEKHDADGSYLPAEG